MSNLSENKLIQLGFEEKCLEALQNFAFRRHKSDEDQVQVDLKRIDGFTMKEGEKEKWTYIKKDNGDKDNQFPITDFFSEIGNLNKAFQEVILSNLHQGGMFFSNRQFLTFHLNALGFVPDADTSRHHIVFEFNPEELIITEKYNIGKLKLFSEDTLKSGFKIIGGENGELIPIDFNDSEKKEIVRFQNFIKKLLCNSNSDGLKLKDKNGDIYLGFDTEPYINLMEFTVKYTVKLDQTSSTSKIEKLSEKDVSFKAQRQLYTLSSKTSKPEFSKFLQPPEPNSFREFILLLFNLLYNLFVSLIPAETPLSSQNKSNESENNFSYRMRA